VEITKVWVIEDNGYELVLVSLEDDNPQPTEPEPQQLELFELDECY
jgi:hypothetical protein